MLAAPSKALYSVAMQGIKTLDSETSSIRSEDRSIHSSSNSIIKKSISTGGFAMEKTQSDGSSASRNMTHENSEQYKQLKQGLGAKGLGRVIRTTIEGIAMQT